MIFINKFFKNISVKIENSVLLITVEELPVIENIKIAGVTAKKYIEAIKENFKLKERSSYNEILLSKEVNTIKNTLKDFGFYFAEVQAHVEELENNSLIIIYKIELGEKAKISKISFIETRYLKIKN